MSVTGVVLAGGRGSRFGQDKLALEIDGAPLLDRAIEAIASVADEVIVAGRGAGGSESEAGGRGRWIEDAEPFAGPLAGLAGALAVAGGTRAIIVGGDMPELVPDVLRAMLDELDGDPTIEAVTLEAPLAAEGGAAQIQTLPLALVIEPARRAASEALDAGQRSLVSLLDRLARTALRSARWQSLDPDANTLLDVDTAADLDRIRARLAH